MIGIYVSDERDIGQNGDFSANSFEKAKNLLAGIDGGARRSIGAAISRTVTSSKAYAARAVRKEYRISSSDFKKYTRVTYRKFERLTWHIRAPKQRARTRS